MEEIFAGMSDSFVAHGLDAMADSGGQISDEGAEMLREAARRLRPGRSSGISITDTVAGGDIIASTSGRWPWAR
jgi:hypothetical protein